MCKNYKIESSDYILFNETREVYLKRSRKKITVDEEVFYGLKQIIWNEKYQNKKKKGMEISYNVKVFDEERELVDFIEDKSLYTIEEHFENKVSFLETILRLSKKEQSILCLYYVEGYTDKEISSCFGVTQQTIQRQRVRSLEKLKRKKK